MPDTYKEGQVDSLFDPKTSDDRAVVHLLKAMDEVAVEHKGDGHFMELHGMLAGMATRLAMRSTSTFDGAFVDRLTNSMGAEFTRRHES